MLEKFISAMAEKVGISEAQAKMVLEFLKQHADELPELLGGDALSALKDKLPGNLSKFF